MALYELFEVCEEVQQSLPRQVHAVKTSMAMQPRSTPPQRNSELALRLSVSSRNLQPLLPLKPDAEPTTGLGHRRDTVRPQRHSASDVLSIVLWFRNNRTGSMPSKRAACQSDDERRSEQWLPQPCVVTCSLDSRMDVAQRGYC